MIRYRLITLPSGKAHGPWRNSRAEVAEDAIAKKMADRDEFDPKRIWWDPLVDVEEWDDGL